MYRTCLLGLALSAAAFAANADTLLLDGVEISAQTADQRPSRGLSMATVQARFGEPANKSGAVGDPPISRWEYPGFTVFFEYDHVIHAVPRR